MIVLVAISMAICTVFIYQLYDKTSALKGICLGITLWLFIYILSSAILFWSGLFSIFRVIILSLLVSAVITVCIAGKRKKIPQTFLYKKECIMLLLVLCMVLPFATNKFQFYGMIQDEGVYQTKAIELLNGNNERVFDFDEYKTLETDGQKEEYFETVSDLAGYDLYDSNKPTLSEEKKSSDVAGIFHGIPTFPALLALFAEMFGLSHMQDCQTLFLILMLMLVFYTMENLKVKLPVQIISMLVLGLSPGVIWISKSALTEMFLSLVVAAYILLMTEEWSDIKVLSCIPISVFAFYHVSIYTMIPMFLLVYWGEYIRTEDKKYLISANIITVMYYIGFLFMVYISPTYTTNNYVRPLDMIPFINDNTLIGAVSVCCIIAFAVNNVLEYRGGGLLFIEYCKNKVNWLLVYKYCLIVFSVGVSLIGIYKVLKEGYYPSNITIVAYAMLSGMVMLPMIIIKIIFEKVERLNDNFFFLSIVFLYTIMIYSVIMRPTTSFYYYTRYLTPYLIVICILWSTLYSSFKIWKLLLAGGISLISYVQADNILLRGRDDSLLEWHILEDIFGIEEEENSAWIVSDSLKLELFLPLNSKGYDVYNEWSDVDQEFDFLLNKYECIYYITDDIFFENADKFEIEYRADNVASEDISVKLQRILRYPLEFSKSYNTISVYKMVSEKLLYDIASPNFEGTGFSNLESYFAWTSPEANIVCWLEEKNYQATIQQGTNIPLRELNINEFEVDVYINNNYLSTLTVDKKNNGDQLIFEIPESYINKGKNIVTMKCNAWSPEDYGLDDSRRIGIAFQSLELRALENEK